MREELTGLYVSDMASDPIIKAQALKNIKRELYQVFDVKIILPKGEKGKEIDKFLTDAIKKLRDSGKFNTIMGVVDQKFDAWQP